MKIFVACPSGAIDRVRVVMEALRAVGHEITHDWAEGFEARCLSGYDSVEEASVDLRGIRKADFVLFCDAPGAPTKGGAYVELGYALGKSKPIRVVRDDVACPPERGAIYLWYVWAQTKVTPDMQRAWVVAQEAWDSSRAGPVPGRPGPERNPVVPGVARAGSTELPGGASGVRPDESGASPDPAGHSCSQEIPF